MQPSEEANDNLQYWMAYKSLFEQTNDAVFLLDLEGRHIRINRRAVDMMGYLPEEMEGLSVRDLSVEPEQSSKILQRLLAGECVPPYERRFRRKDGTIFPVEINVELVKDSAGIPLYIQSIVRDITERQQSEAMLRESEAQYRLLYTTMSEGSGLYELIYDESGKAIDYWILDVNPAYEIVTGWSRERVVGRRAKDIHDPINLAIYEEVVATRKPATFEVHFPKLGKYLHASAFWVEGKRFATVFTDITERKQAEEALRQSEARYRIISELMSDFAFSFRVEPDNEIILDWMTADPFMRLTGYTHEEIVSRETYALYHPDDQPLVRQHIQMVLNGQVVTGEYRIQTKWGETRWMQVYRQPVWDERENRVVRFYGVTQDITERKQAEEALQQSEERLQQAAHAGNIGIFDHDHITDTFYGSLEMRNIYGWGPEEPGSLPRCLEQIHPDDREQIEQAVKRSHDPAGDGLYNVEYRIIDCSGAMRWLSVCARTAFMGEGAARHSTRTVGAVLDITERKQAERALRLNNFALERTSDAVQWMDSKGRIVDVNEAACRMLEYSREELVGMSLDGINPIIDMADWPEVWERVKEGSIPPVESFHRTKSGRLIPVEIISNYIVFEGKELDCAFARDITKRKRAEEALRQSEARYRIISELMSDFAFSFRVEPDNEIVLEWMTADSFTRLTGYTPEENASRGTYALYHPDDQPLARQHIQTVLSGQVVVGEYRIQTKQGETRWLQVYRQPVWDEQSHRVTRFYGVAQDITERKQAEETLRESESTIRALFNAQTESVFMINTAAIILALNENAAQYFAGRADELIGKCLWNLIPPEVVEVRKAQIESIMRSRQPIHFEEQRAGKWFEVWAYPVVDTQNEVTRVAVVARDITERKRAEQRERTLALERERMQILSNFITQAAHEFRTPLATINTSTYLLKKADNPQVQQRHIEKVEERVRDITILVEALTTMARLDGLYRLDTEAIELCQLLEMTQVTMQKNMQAKQIQCRVQCEAGSLFVLGNGDDLRQAIECIVDNAIRFTPDAGQITLRLVARNGQAVIEVTDTGEGIDDMDLPHIFERFYRADKYGTTRGFGLGLPIAQRIVELHQGNIEVTSIPGAGSTFKICLPILHSQ